MTSVFYGISGNYIDVTNICYDNLKADKTFDIPAGDFERNDVFGDPLIGVVKQIVLKNKNTADFVLPIGWSYKVTEFDIKRYKLSIATLFRDSAFYLKEWIEFHLLVGVEHFYLGNHSSIDNYLSILQPYIDSNVVELINVNDNTTAHFEYGVHIPFMNRAIKEMRYRTEWLALIDVDEFITPVFDKPVDQCNYSGKIYEILSKMKSSTHDLGGVGLNWVCYGNAKIDKLRNTEFMMERLNMRSKLNDPINHHLKCIVLTERVESYDVHKCVYLDQYKTYHMSGKSVTTTHTDKPIVDQLRLTHYKMADEYYYHWIKLPFYVEYFMTIKCPLERWIAWKQEYCNSDVHNDEYDNYMSQFSDLLRKKRGVENLNHYIQDADFKETLKIMYGTHGALKDVTALTMNLCCKNNNIVIPVGDRQRNDLFGDPNVGNHKHTFIVNNSKMQIYRCDESIEINFNS